MWPAWPAWRWDSPQHSLESLESLAAEINLTPDLSLLAPTIKLTVQELDHLTNSFGQLKQAQGRFRSCVNDIDALTPDTLDREVLVPLTSSLYVPGKLGDTSHLIVDVGTGYYVKKVGVHLGLVHLCLCDQEHRA